MNKKVTTIAGIAIGASLLAGAGYGLYTFIAKKIGRKAANLPSEGTAPVKHNHPHAFVGNGLVKSLDLYGLGYVDNGLVAGGLYRGSLANG